MTFYQIQKIKLNNQKLAQMSKDTGIIARTRGPNNLIANILNMILK